MRVPRPRANFLRAWILGLKLILLGQIIFFLPSQNAHANSSAPSGDEVGAPTLVPVSSSRIAMKKGCRIVVEGLPSLKAGDPVYFVLPSGGNQVGTVQRSRGKLTLVVLSADKCTVPIQGAKVMLPGESPKTASSLSLRSGVIVDMGILNRTEAEVVSDSISYGQSLHVGLSLALSEQFLLDILASYRRVYAEYSADAEGMSNTLTTQSVGLCPEIAFKFSSFRLGLSPFFYFLLSGDNDYVKSGVSGGTAIESGKVNRSFPLTSGMEYGAYLPFLYHPVDFLYLGVQAGISLGQFTYQVSRGNEVDALSLAYSGGLILGAALSF